MSAPTPMTSPVTDTGRPLTKVAEGRCDLWVDPADLGERLDRGARSQHHVFRFMDRVSKALG